MKKSLNAFQLKCITVAMMIGGIGIQQILHIVNKNLFASGGKIPGAISVPYYLGYLLYVASFPIAAFLLVEAAKKTTNRKALLLR